MRGAYGVGCDVCAWVCVEGWGEPHTTAVCRQAGAQGMREGREMGRLGGGATEPTLAEEHPSLQTCRLGATMAVTMTVEEEFPLPPPPP